MENTLSEFEEERESRPTLLTVLCILTFIGSSWAIVTNIWGFSTAAKTAAIFQQREVLKTGTSATADTAVAKAGRKKKEFLGQKVMASVSKMMTVDNIRKIAISKALASLLTLVGAWLMWYLRKKGYYIYIIGGILGLVAPFYVYGNNLIALGMASLPGFFGLVFIALYALNLKSMK